ncbi:WD domain, g-beta repeat domain-containing protein [Trichoderma breve]|uniref:Mitochondrial division protein 1 n=1 Tax=Trichoderma breve TaxID=2034170 RepID=A0A9W9ECH7_9HYPO|nr:WD domain, g-beta repeat domain-containing protein [Trichoderma breve]KAJ4864203.1 WD domain, g-beta repeat domain-containing protein [Trichoderma breve]
MTMTDQERAHDRMNISDNVFRDNTRIRQGDSARFQLNGPGSIQNNNTGSQISAVGSNASVNFHYNRGSTNKHQCLVDLRSTNPRDDKARIEHSKGHLLPGSYQWVLENAAYQQWRRTENTQVLWIKGDPGKGKTMLLCGIIDELTALEHSTNQQPGMLVSYFFCEAADARSNDATSVLRGLIYLLADKQPSLIRRIQKKHDHAGKALFEDTNAWFAVSGTFTEILQDLQSKDTYLIIDALDESSSSSHVKWIISSRNQPQIERRIKSDQHWVTLSLEQNAEHVSRSVDEYIKLRVADLASIAEDEALQSEVRNIMRQKAHGTFLWVSLVIGELDAASSWEIQKHKPWIVEKCWLLLSTAAVAYRPLQLDELALLAGVQDRDSDKLQFSTEAVEPQFITEVVKLCGSFLTILNGDAYRNIFPFGINYTHHAIFWKSIQIMCRVLRRDIYGLVNPAFPIDKVQERSLDPLVGVYYSCVYWVDHLEEAEQTMQQRGDAEPSDDLIVYIFLKNLFLYWLEALSLRRSISSGVLAVAKLEQLLSTYSSALIFSPTRCLIRQYFRHEQPPWITILEGHTSSINAVSFSPDCQRLASASDDFAVLLWDANTGALLKSLTAHTSKVLSVAFSLNGERLASGCHDGRVCLWDVDTGAMVWNAKKHDNPVLSVIFSSDHGHVTSASVGGLIWSWDVRTGALLSAFVETTNVTVIAFAPNGKWVATVFEESGKMLVNLWDVRNGMLLRTFKGSNCRVWSIIFSPDGEQLALTTYDAAAPSGRRDSVHVHYIWRLSERALEKHKIINGDFGRVWSAAFSPDCKTLAAGCGDGMVRLWDPTTGMLIRSLKGNTNQVNSVVFSSNGQKLASASYDGMLRLWDVHAAVPKQALVQRSRVTLMAFSPDYRQLVSASYSKTLLLWDTSSGWVQHELKDLKSRVCSVAFSSNSKVLAAGFCDGTVWLWDTQTAERLMVLDSNINYVAFSPDGRLLASALYEGTLLLWDRSTGAVRNILKGHTGKVNSVVFSSDSRKLASASDDSVVLVWNVASGGLLLTLQGNTDRLLSVAFSPDNQRLLANSHNGMLWHWDVATGMLLKTYAMEPTPHLSFLNESTIITDRTITSLDDLSHRSEAGGGFENHDDSKAVGWTLSEDRCWVHCNGRSVLWLPPEYRPVRSAVATQKLAIGCSSGNVLVLGFTSGVYEWNSRD